jgi:hypothetical protein
MLQTTIIMAIFCGLLTPGGVTQAYQEGVNSATTKRVEALLATEPQVTLRFCAASGHIVVRGWERNEVRASSVNAAQIELRREPQSTGMLPAAQVQVITHESADLPTAQSDNCRVFSNIELDVPHLATVWLKTRGGNITVEGLANVFIETLSGTVDLRHVSKKTKVDTISGDVWLNEVGGDVTVGSSSGNIKVTNADTLAESDRFRVRSVSGNVSLEQLNYKRVEAETVSGRMSLWGPLTPGGHYGLKSTLGDVTLTLPADASFQVHATVSKQGKILNDFAVNAGEGRMPVAVQNLKGSYGSGEAALELSSFSGLVRIRRK